MTIHTGLTATSYNTKNPGLYTRPKLKSTKPKPSDETSEPQFEIKDNAAIKASISQSKSRSNTNSSSSSSESLKDRKIGGTPLTRSRLEYLGGKKGGKLLNSKSDLGITFEKKDTQVRREVIREMYMKESETTKKIHQTGPGRGWDETTRLGKRTRDLFGVVLALRGYWLFNERDVDADLSLSANFVKPRHDFTADPSSYTHPPQLPSMSTYYTHLNRHIHIIHIINSNYTTKCAVSGEASHPRVPFNAAHPFTFPLVDNIAE
jgi:hypothetical protein